jgi:hypothetical protein
MTLSRRQFLMSGLSAAAATAVGPWSVLGAPGTAAAAGTTANTSSLYAKSTWRPLLGSKVTVRTATGPQAWLLREVKDLGASVLKSRSQGSGEIFSLLLQGPSKVKFAQGTFKMSHPTLGRFSFFAVPVGTGRNYEVVVNRWLPHSS